jgi:hypothetical protein
MKMKKSAFLVLRHSLGLKVAGETRLFKRGDILSGVLEVHPLNSARKVLISTESGIFNFNAEDIKEVKL